MTESPIAGRRWQIDRWLVIAALLLAWGLRLCCLEAVPAGWRDDELINIHALSGEVLSGHYPPYFAGANGHEPLYHYLHAGVHAVLGFNVLSGHLLSVTFGTLTVALTYVLTQRLFGRVTALVGSLSLATSFWSLMYSRTAIRHISLPPLALATLYWLWRSLTPPSQTSKSRVSRFVAVGLVVGISLYTYPAARLLPVLLASFAAYLALLHRDEFRHHWRGFVLTFALITLAALPLGIVITQVAGADARIGQLANPLRELWAGNPRPLLENLWKTLGMFHATGDPEWLYNIPDRPVFNWLGGLLTWAGVVLCLYRWRQPRYFLLLLWFGLGLLPTFLSIPAASLSHSILVQPLVHVFAVLPLAEVCRRLESRTSIPGPRRLSLFIAGGLLGVFLVTNAIRDLRDYFILWPKQDMVRVLYRADYREAAAYLDAHPEITDIAVSSTLLGPWDRLALDLDTRRDDIAVRVFDPGRAMVWSGGDHPSRVLLTSWPHPAPPIEGFLEATPELPEAISPHLTLYTLPLISDLGSPPSTPLARFANGLQLVDIQWVEGPPHRGRKAILLTVWQVATELDLPSIPIVASPPPPGVHSGPRLKVFTHLLAPDGTLVVGDDGLWVDPLTLHPGDRFVQAHRYELASDAPDGPYTLEAGLYNPKTGERWELTDFAGQVAERVLLPAAGKE